MFLKAKQDNFKLNRIGSSGILNRLKQEQDKDVWQELEKMEISMN